MFVKFLYLLNGDPLTDAAQLPSLDLFLEIVAGPAKGGTVIHFPIINKSFKMLMNKKGILQYWPLEERLLLLILVNRS